MVHIYYMRFDASVSNQQKDLYMQFLSEERRGRVLRRKSSKAACECMQTGLFLRYGLEQLEEKDLYRRVKVKENGKPYIEDSDLYFNVSHSGDYVILMIADSDCGIDLQKQVNSQDKLAKRIMHEEEYMHYSTKQEEGQKSELLSWCWSAKEAYLKYTGDGIRYAMSGLNMTNFLLNSTVNCLGKPSNSPVSSYENTLERQHIYMLRFRLEEKYYGTICMGKPFCLNIINPVTIQEVFSHFNLK